MWYDGGMENMLQLVGVLMACGGFYRTWLIRTGRV